VPEMEARSTPSKNILLVSFEGYQDWIVCPGCQQVSSRDEAIGDDYVEDNFLLYCTRCHIEVLLCWPPSPVSGGVCSRSLSPMHNYGIQRSIGLWLTSTVK
jgi:hypothetical protein